MKSLNWIILIISFVLTDGAPTTEQPSNNLNITNEFNDGIARILAKFRPTGGRDLISSTPNTVIRFQIESHKGILRTITTKLIFWPAYTIKLPSNNEDKSMSFEHFISVALDFALSTSKQQRIETENVTARYIVKLTQQNEFSPQNEIINEDLNLNQNEIKLLANGTEYKPNDETGIKKEIETHIKETLHEWVIRTENIGGIEELKQFILTMFDRFSHNNQERYYYINAIPSTSYTLNNVSIYGLWNAKSVSFNGTNLSNLPEIDMGSVRGSLVQNFPSTSEELSFKADNIYILADHIPKAKVVVKGYSVVNVKLNTTLAEDQSKLIIGAIESAMAASIQSLWDTEDVRKWQ